MCSCTYTLIYMVSFLHLYKYIYNTMAGITVQSVWAATKWISSVKGKYGRDDLSLGVFHLRDLHTRFASSLQKKQVLKKISAELSDDVMDVVVAIKHTLVTTNIMEPIGTFILLSKRQPICAIQVKEEGATYSDMFVGLVDIDYYRLYGRAVTLGMSVPTRSGAPVPPLMCAQMTTAVKEELD